MTTLRLPQRVRRFLTWHRRAVAASLAALAVGASVLAVRPAPPDTVPVLRASQDLPGGVALDGSHIEVFGLAPSAVPDGALRPGDAVEGQVLTAAVRRGETLTDARLLTAGLLSGSSPGLVAAPVRIADAAAVSLLRPGDLVDVLAADADRSSARVVARGVRVLTVPEERSALSASGGALVVLSSTSDQARSLAAAAAGAPLSVVLRGADPGDSP
jgi:pilus assembly protein CpaB